jgi:multisubunit Na+/H+ antiporter MnhG subunit
MTAPRITLGEAGWALCAIGLLLSVLGWIIEPRVFPHAWLAAVYTWLLWPLGSMALVMAHALTGGRWGEAARPGLLAGITTLPLIVIAIIPVLCTMPGLYDWARPGAHVPNAFYLNLSFFTLRCVIYLVVWLALAGLTLFARGTLLRRLSPPGLILLAVTFSFAAIDLTMSLEDFVSEIYGMMEAASAGLLALSVAVLIVQPVVENAEVRADLSRILLALVILWTYLDFMQLLIIWESDLASDAPWYVHRTTLFWGLVMGLIEILRFAIPFFVLVTPRGQRSRRAVTVACGTIIAGTILRGWWLVLPAAYHGVGRPIGWIDIAAMLAFMGFSLGWITRETSVHQLRQRLAARHV